VRDDENGVLRPREQPVEPGRVARDELLSVLSAAGGLGRRVVGVRPREIGVERTAFVATVQWIIELRKDDPWNCSVPERELRGLASSLELRRHAEVDLFVGELLREAPRLRNATGAQGAADIDSAIRDPTRAEDALCVADKERSLHRGLSTSADVRGDEQIIPGAMDRAIRETNALRDGCDTEVTDGVDAGAHDRRRDPDDEAVDELLGEE
jgi:hypothetical protein